MPKYQVRHYYVYADIYDVADAASPEQADAFVRRLLASIEGGNPDAALARTVTVVCLKEGGDWDSGVVEDEAGAITEITWDETASHLPCPNCFRRYHVLLVPHDTSEAYCTGCNLALTVIRDADSRVVGFGIPGAEDIL